jgi:hypothetical protein
VALYKDSRRSLLLLESILETPVLMERLLEILRPADQSERVVSAAPDKRKAIVKAGRTNGHTARKLVKHK